MLLQKSDSLEVAEAIVKELSKFEYSNTVVVESYSNGKEQGFSIYNNSTSFPRRVSFALHYHHQNCVVIYQGLKTDFDNQTNAPKNNSNAELSHRLFQLEKFADNKKVIAYIAKYIAKYIDCVIQYEPKPNKFRTTY